MPTYDYKCLWCNTKTELIVPMNLRDNVTCSDCGAPLIRKITFDGWVWHPTSGSK